MTDKIRPNQPKLRSSAVIQSLRYRQFYEMIIKDAKRILPMVNEYRHLCVLDKCSSSLETIIEKVTRLHHVNREYKNSFSLKEYNNRDSYRNTPAWKSDRIFLLNEIIKYCEYKLEQS